MSSSHATTGDLLTPDEKLLHAPRWQGETVDFPTAIRMWAKRYDLASELAIDEQSNWEEAINELETMVQPRGDSSGQRSARRP
jgi:hypothetical protein